MIEWPNMCPRYIQHQKNYPSIVFDSQLLTWEAITKPEEWVIRFYRENVNIWCRISKWKLLKASRVTFYSVISTLSCSIRNLLLWKMITLLSPIFFRYIKSLVIYVKPLLTRNFCQKSVRVKFRNLLNVYCAVWKLKKFTLTPVRGNYRKWLSHFLWQKCRESN